MDKKIKSGIIGHAIGDAMGVPVEFMSRKVLMKKPILTMEGYGSHDVPAGSFSDDTSMTLATIHSFIEKECFDYADIMKKFELWVIDGEYTPQGKLFDIGRTCLSAIRNYSKGINPIDCGLKYENSNGNGSLMRILPVAFYAYYKNLNDEEIYLLVKDLSSLTHAHEISVLGCYIYIQYVLCILKGYDKWDSYKLIKNVNYSFFSEYALNKYNRILKDNIYTLQVNSIKSTAYVVDTLEAVLWVLLSTSTYKDAILIAINLGDDTDTVGAITGSIAGLLYGYNSIPQEWLNTLFKREYIESMCDEFERLLNGSK